jgi:dTDP-4-dehydrorhamnose 3,5-epimerase
LSNQNNLIEGVVIKSLKVIPDQRGRLMEILRSDDEDFIGFGQIYMTTTLPGIIKAWHYHEKQTDQVCCVQGMIKLVLVDQRKTSPTNGNIMELYCGIFSPNRVVIPPEVWHGWECISQEEAMVINIPDQPYNYSQPDEIRKPWNTTEIQYNWSLPKHA